MSGIGHNRPPVFSGDAGWVAIARAIRSHWLVGFGQPVKPADPSRGSHSRNEAFVDLVMECRYEAGTVNNGGRRMAIQPGQLIGAVSWLASRWNWTPMTVRTFLDKLEADGMIERMSPGASEHNKQLGKQATVISVCNYSEYQSARQAEQHAEQHANNTQTTSRQQASNNTLTREQGNKGTKEKEDMVLAAPADDAAQDRSHEIVALVEPVTASTTSAASEVDIDPMAAFEAWNDLAQRCGLQQSRTLTPQRRKSIAARIREHGGQAAWHRALANVERSSFLRGTNNRGWRATLDFLCQASSFAKVIDGAYGNGAGHATQADKPRHVNHAMEFVKAQLRGEKPTPVANDRQLITIDTDWSRQ